MEVQEAHKPPDIVVANAVVEPRAVVVEPAASSLSTWYGRALHNWQGILT
jgi:hypothetical protein